MYKRIKTVKTPHVADAWVQGYPAQNPSGSHRTDGRRIWSYNREIGIHLDHCAYIDFDAQKCSRTTATHIGYIRRAAASFGMEERDHKEALAEWRLVES